MKKILTILMLAGLTGGAYAGTVLRSLQEEPGAVAQEIAVPLPPPPSPLAVNDPFDVRKVYAMPAGETWSGPFTIQFRKGADLAAVARVLKAEGLEAKELLNAGWGFYARIDMKDEFAMVKVMRLVDYDAVAVIFVNKRLNAGIR